MLEISPMLDLFLSSPSVPGKTLALSPVRPFSSWDCNISSQKSFAKTASFALRLNEFSDRHFWIRNGWPVILSALNRRDSSTDGQTGKVVRKRKVVEHIFLLKARETLSDQEEKDMLDYLYTAQYQMGGIVAISLGRLVDLNTDGFTHAVYMRFQQKEDLAKFYEISSTGIFKEHVMPYCHDLISVDYESEVEDDILPIFRKGKDFNYGVEFILLISVVESAFGEPVNDALDALTNLILHFDSLIVQATQGANINPFNRDYTHAVTIRFPSFEAFTTVKDSSDYSNVWMQKFRPIISKSLAVYFAVDPVGTEII